MTTDDAQKPKVLIVTEDEDHFIKLMGDLKGELSLCVRPPEKALETLRAEQISITLLDIHPDLLSGGGLMETIHREIDPNLPVIILLDKPDVEAAVLMMRCGADDCFVREQTIPATKTRILEAIERTRSPLTSIQHKSAILVAGGGMMRRVDYDITRLAQFDFDVLIEGETGVGKDLVAHELHERGRRKDKPFITVLVKSLSESLIEAELFGHEKGAFSGAEKTKIGKLEAADGGTLYIPEVSSLTEATQLKLLHFIQYKTISRVGQDAKDPERKLDLRLVFATNQPLDELVVSGQMRKDFFYRISGLKLSIPSLRGRRDDIELLANHFLDLHSRSTGVSRWLDFSTEVLEAFREHDWPGNVRELENSIKGAIARCEGRVLTLKDFPDLHQRRQMNERLGAQFANTDIFPGLEAAETNFRRSYFREVLKRSGNSISKAAQTAGLTPQGLRKILMQLSITRDDAD